ncbi:tail fiber assembly protein [Lysobacter soli]|uniref:tail fiber assembly protein n=1 Tax=Lysobacter soli TaxID=453783 RepID=UPI0037CC2BF5
MSGDLSFEMRIRRNQLLRGSDWTQIADNNLTAQERAAWSAYRAILRDVPQQPGFPDVAWPVPPSMQSGAGTETGELS